jgi:hypothetical protein
MSRRLQAPGAALLLLCGAISLFTLEEPAASADESDAQAPKPVLHITDGLFNWGKAFRGEQMEHTFTIENRGTAPLIIESLKPSCGCMSVANENDLKKRLEPGEKATVLLHIDTQILEPGPVKGKYTEIISNAIGDENRLSIEGEIEELFKLAPPHPAVEVVRASGLPDVPTIVSLDATGGRSVKVLSLEPRKGILSSKLREIEKGKKYEVSLLPSVKDTKTVFQNEDLEAKLDVDGKEIPFRIEVAVKLKDRIDVQPSQSVYFRRVETENSGVGASPKAKKSLEIGSIGGPKHAFKVTGVSVKEQIFSAAVETIEPGRRYRLNVTLEKAPQKGERFLKDSIEVTTDDPEVPSIKIPASAQF